MDPVGAQLEMELRKSEPPIGDDGFSEGVMDRLPGIKRRRAGASRWTLAGAVATGSFVMSLLGAPVEAAFSAFVLANGPEMAFVAAFLVIVTLSLPVAWTFFSR